MRSRRHRSRSMKRKFKAGLTPSSPMSCHWGPFGVMIQYLPLCLHDFDVAVYRSPLPSVTQRNKCEVGKTPRSAIDHRQRTFLQSSSASRFTADASAFFILSAATIPIAALSPGSPHHANECQDDHHDDNSSKFSGSLNIYKPALSTLMFFMGCRRINKTVYLTRRHF